MEDVPGPKEKCPPYEFYRFQRHTPKSRWLMAQRVFHGLDPITPELKEVIYACTNCLMCQELCGVRNDGYGPWDITVAMREEITEKEGPLDAHRPIYEGLNKMTALGRSLERSVALGPKDWESKTRGEHRRPRCSSPAAPPTVPAVGAAYRAGQVDAKAGEDFAILGAAENCCGLYAFDLGFRREYGGVLKPER
jgi:Fe-S oxidoreductase